MVGDSDHERQKIKLRTCSEQPSNPLAHCLVTLILFIFVVSCTNNKSHEAKPLKDVVIAHLAILLVLCNPELYSHIFRRRN
jgi:hypothetical protein